MSEPNKAHDRKVETVAKLIADHVGHGMREKCISIAEQLVRALASSEPLPLAANSVVSEVAKRAADLIADDFVKGYCDDAMVNQFAQRIDQAIAAREPGEAVAWMNPKSGRCIHANELSGTVKIGAFGEVGEMKKCSEVYTVPLCYAHPPTAATPVGIVGERGDVSWRSDQILPVGTKLYAASTQPDSLCAKHLANCTFPKCDCTEDTQPEQVREVDEAMVTRALDAFAKTPTKQTEDFDRVIMRAALTAALREPRA